MNFPFHLFLPISSTRKDSHVIDHRPIQFDSIALWLYRQPTIDHPHTHRLVFLQNEREREELFGWAIFSAMTPGAIAFALLNWTNRVFGLRVFEQRKYTMINPMRGFSFSMKRPSIQGISFCLERSIDDDDWTGRNSVLNGASELILESLYSIARNILLSYGFFLLSNNIPLLSCEHSMRGWVCKQLDDIMRMFCFIAHAESERESELLEFSDASCPGFMGFFAWISSCHQWHSHFSIAPLFFTSLSINQLITNTHTTKTDQTPTHARTENNGQAPWWIVCL